MQYKQENPLIIQSDGTILLEVDNTLFTQARDSLAKFAELEKSPEHIHTYRLSNISLWNAASLGIKSDSVVEDLTKYSKYDLPKNIIYDIHDAIARYGKLKLSNHGSMLKLEANDRYIITELWNSDSLKPYIEEFIDDFTLLISPINRGFLKQALIKIGYPVEDLAGYVEGKPFDVTLRETTLGGMPFGMRKYQTEAVDAFHAGGTEKGGSGVVVLPCGSGKTVIGIGVMNKTATMTLILTTNITALRQWRQELIDKTFIDPDDIGEYSGEHKDIKPITIATYNILTYRKIKTGVFPHFSLFNREE